MALEEPVEVKICGINSADAMKAALDGGADYVGLVFYPPSPRYVTPDQAVPLAALVPEMVIKVGLFVDIDDDTLGNILKTVPLDFLQLHGSESPARVAEIKSATGLPVMKAIKVASAEDVEAARKYCDIVDMLLFDAKTPADMEGALPGGNALAFDWQLLGGRDWPVPWMLSGGLDATNVAEAVRITGTPAIDVSSGVEDAPGVKSPAKITEFLSIIMGL